MTNLNPREDDNLGSFYMGRMRAPPEPRRILPKGLLTTLTLLCFVAIIWYAYPQGQEKYSGLDIPTIQADKSAWKFKPENPGGMEVPHQDSTVFAPMENDPAAIDAVKKLGPPPEEPLDKIEAIQSAPIGLNTERLNPDVQIKEIGGGTEKIVVKQDPPPQPAPVKSEKAPLPAPKPETAAKEAPKAATPKAEPAKAKAAGAEPAQTATAPPSAPAKGQVYIQLGSYRDLKAAQEDWKFLQRKFPQTLGKLSMRTQRVDLGAKGVFNRLQAGAVTEARAQEICKLLKAGGNPGCIIVK